MKKYFIYTLFTIIAFVAALVSVSCDDNDNTGDNNDALTITINNENSVNVSFDNDGGNKSFTVHANADWKVSFSNESASEWITMSKNEGTTGTTEVTMTVTQNENEEKREATLEFIAANDNGSALASVTVSQWGTEKGRDEYYMTVTPSNKSVSSAAGSFDITIESNVEWTVSSSDEENFALSTISGSNNGTVTVTYTANESTTESREIVITVIPSIETVDTAIIPVTQSKSSGTGGGGGSEASMTITIDTMVEGQTSDFALIQTTYDYQTFETPYTWTQLGFGFAGYKVCIPNGRDEYIGSIQGQGNDSDEAKQMLIYNTGAINNIRKVVITFSDARLAIGDYYDPKEFSFYAGGSEQPSASDTVITENRTQVDGIKYTSEFDLTTGSFEYFTIHNNHVGAFYIWSIDIYYMTQR